MRIEAYIIRIIHSIISIYFIACLIYLYFSLLTNQESVLLYIAIISLLLEGLIIFLNNSNCPLGVLHKKYGDDKTFFEIFLPKKVAQNAIPVLAIVSVAGIVLFFIQRIF